jgi:hypothetical protein
MHIEDGTGSGVKAEVTANNKLAVFSTNITLLEHLNESDGVVWNIPIDAVAPSGATKFFYLANTGTEMLGIARIVLASSTAGVFKFIKVTGTPSGGSNITAVPANLGSPVLPVATIQSGTNITGLSDGGLLAPLYLQANVTQVLDIPQIWYLPPNTALAIQAPASATVNGYVLVFNEYEGHD